jgi:peptidoglycan/xylan/chitin deacetylase (PgdA/CDA1 family)
VFRPGFFGKVQRTSVLEHYGLRTLLYGTLLPGPDIGKECAGTMRQVRDAGFEVGIHCWDHVRWQDGVAQAGAGWTSRELELAFDRFEEVFGGPAQVHGAAGWQVNRHALKFLDQSGIAYASDTRGTAPFLPAWEGERFSCPQLPTTLPTLDEVLGLPGVDVLSSLLEKTESKSAHVYTAHAELEGGKLAGTFERLMEGWKRQGYEVCDLKSLCNEIEIRRLPVHEIQYGEVPGRSGTLALQGKELRA